MPIYEYECPKCGRFDHLQKMSSPALEIHEVCGSKVTKLMSASAFAFKGSGFYITDYNGRNSAAITGKSDKPESKPEPKADACATCPAKQGAGAC
ncbi:MULTISPECIES: FmdB family zinc ribbon protein [Anaeromyxobacter]|jgi:putative FmdB family regulatory protein|uniref:FmdB family zinc ribbon protein n=1 Tax=Anaeromyxobacter TaxID=161492 RepID=UPI001F58531A|nr:MULTISPECIES: FmdB family zinc ribbon protein [unclassified Anaeromyxobacter]